MDSNRSVQANKRGAITERILCKSMFFFRLAVIFNSLQNTFWKQFIFMNKR